MPATDANNFPMRLSLKGEINDQGTIHRSCHRNRRNHNSQRRLAAQRDNDRTERRRVDTERQRLMLWRQLHLSEDLDRTTRQKLVSSRFGNMQRRSVQWHNNMARCWRAHLDPQSLRPSLLMNISAATYPVAAQPKDTQMHVKFPLALLLVTAFLLASLSSAHAGQTTIRPFSQAAVEAWRDCAPDRHRFCAAVPIGGGRIIRCLMDHQDRLSPACRRHTVKIDAVQAAAADCKRDATRFCQDVRPGGGRLISCLAGNSDRLSHQCRNSLRDADSILRY